MLVDFHTLSFIVQIWRYQIKDTIRKVKCSKFSNEVFMIYNFSRKRKNYCQHQNGNKPKLQNKEMFSFRWTPTATALSQTPFMAAAECLSESEPTLCRCPIRTACHCHVTCCTSCAASPLTDGYMVGQLSVQQDSNKSTDLETCKDTLCLQGHRLVCSGPMTTKRATISRCLMGLKLETWTAFCTVGRWDRWEADSCLEFVKVFNPHIHLLCVCL